MSRKLYVGNLPYETNDQDLQELFATAGTVETVNVMRDASTGRARGFAFVVCNFLSTHWSKRTQPVHFAGPLLSVPRTVEKFVRNLLDTPCV